MANPTKQEVKEWVRLFVSQQGNQTGLDGLDEILDVIIDVAWSGTPGPPPELDFCLQVDRVQSFTDEQKQQGRDNLGIQEADTSKCLKVDRIQSFTNAEKAQGVDNLGPQQILDAIKELAGTLKNKTIDADDNTIKDLTGKEVKDGYLVQAVPDDRYFYGWEYVTMPDVFTKSGADAPTVDIYAIQDGKMQLVDTGRISAGNLVRGTVIYARKDSVDGYYVDDSDIKFAGLELALKILALVKALKATYLKVATFTGVTGDTSVLYYLDTKYDAYEKGFYIFNGSAFVNVDQKCVQYVSTFTGVDGDPDVLYYLDTDYSTFKAGFHRFLPASGSTPARFEPLLKALVQYVSTFTGLTGDPDVLYYLDTAYGTFEKGFYRFVPAAGGQPEKFVLLNKDLFKYVSTFTGETGDTDRLYYLDTAYGTYKKGFHRFNGTAFVNINPKEFFYVSTFTGVVGDDEALYFLDTQDGDSKVGFYRFIPAAGTEPAKFVPVGRPLVQYVHTFVGVTGDDEVLYYLDTAYGDYKVGFYRFIPAAGTEPAKFVLIGAKADVFTDVDELPDTDISKETIYRVPYSYYEYQGQKVEKEDVVFYGPGPQCLNMAADNTGLHMEDSSRAYDYTWDQVNDALVQQLVAGGMAVVKIAIDDAEFFSLAPDSYGPKDELHEVNGGYKLYHNPTETDGEYIEIGGEGTPVEVDDVTIEEVGGKLQANAVIDVAELPTTGIKPHTIYRTRDVSYEYEGVQLPKSELVWYGPGPDCTSMDADDIGVNIRAASGNRSYPWGSVNAALIQELRDQNIVAVGVDEAAAVFFSHFATYGPKDGLTVVYGDYHLYHNSTGTAGGYIEIGGDSVQYVSTFAGVTGDTSALYYLDTAYGDYKKGFYRFNGTFQFIGTDVILTVETLPTTGISDSVFYRLVEYHKYDNGWEIPVANTFMSNSPRMVISPSGIEYTDTQSQIHPYNWADVTDDLVTGWMAGGELQNVPLSDRNFEGKFYKKQDGTYDAMNGGTVYVYIRNEYRLYHNPTKSPSGYIEVGGGSDIVLDEVTTETVDGKVQANAIIDVNALPTTGIKAKTVYRILVDKYYEDGNVLPARPNGYVSIRPAIVVIDENGITDNGTFYAWADITDDQMDFWVIRRQISEVYAADLMTNSACFKTAANHYVYKDHVTKDQVYELYHNPTATANAFIKIGGEGGSAQVDGVTTEEVNGKVQANALIVVNTLPTTGIKTKSLYRRMETVYKHDGVEVPNVTMYKVLLNDTIEATPEGMRYKPSGPVVAWNDANIGAVIQQAITDGHVETATWDDAEFFAYGDGSYDYESHFSRILPGSLWQNADGTAAGWKEVGGEPAIDEVTIVEEHGVLQAVAVIDVTRLPSSGMKANALYRKVETVNVPGMHIYTTYYHGGADPVPEPVECYKPARAGVEFRSNEIYIDSVEHTYEELRVYKADWVAAGYIVACDFLDIDAATNDGAVGYPNEGSYQFLNRDKYTYNTDPVPVVMNKIFQRTPGGEWESISTVQISQAAYNLLDYEQKMDGTTYIVEG